MRVDRRVPLMNAPVGKQMLAFAGFPFSLLCFGNLLLRTGDFYGTVVVATEEGSCALMKRHLLCTGHLDTIYHDLW